MSKFGAVDLPEEGATVAREGFVVQGFAFDEESGAFARLDVRVNGAEIGSTTIRYRRPDVGLAIPKIWDTTCGFRLAATLPAILGGQVAIDVVASFPSGEAWTLRRLVAAGPKDYRNAPYGGLLSGNDSIVYGRDDIYSVGPPSNEASVECVTLLDSYLTAGETVLDVGCGMGAYAPPLIDAGVAWHGCDVNAEFVRVLQERGLEVTLSSEKELPFPDDAFESALCIEVIEHVEEYPLLLNELARVARRRVFFSVPNAEAIPVLADRLLVPWHLLERDHKNFFTRSNLRATLQKYFRNVEVIPYGTMPMASSNGSPVYYHLFAVAEI